MQACWHAGLGGMLGGIKAVTNAQLSSEHNKLVALAKGPTQLNIGRGVPIGEGSLHVDHRIIAGEQLFGVQGG